MSRRSAALLAATALALPATVTAGSKTPSLADLVHEFRLDNGLTLLVVENRDSPTIGAVTAFSVGAAEERPGVHGVTHVLEHMLFKGTPEIGTTDWEAERVHHERVEEITREILRLSASPEPDTARVSALVEERRAEEEAAKAYAVDNELWGLYEEAGGTDLNAFTSYDVTAYIQAIPSNRLELWMYLESERLRRPVLRQFYTEVQNVQEERRLSVESQPGGKLQENFLSVAFDSHGYGFSIIGYPADLDGLTRTETEEWFRVHYAPNRMTIALVGDVDADDAHRRIREYFGDIPAQDPPEPLETAEIERRGARRVEVEFDAEPRVMMGWPKKHGPHPDDAALTVAAEILNGGASSRLRKRLVEERQIAASVDADPAYPGYRWDNLFVVEALPRAPHGPDEVAAAVWEELDRLSREPVGARELEKAKNRLRAERVRDFASNFQLAVELAYAQSALGSWRTILEEERLVEAVTADDVRRVARATFRRNRTVTAVLVPPSFEPDPEREAAGLETVRRMVEALGGERRLAALKAVRSVSDVTIRTPGGDLTAKAESLYGIPGRMRSDFSLFGQTQSQGADADGAWRTQGGAVVDVVGDELKDLRADLEREMFLLAWPAVADGYVVQSTSPAEGAAGAVEVRGPTGRAFTVHVDAAGLPARVRYSSTHPMTGSPADFEETLSQWKAVAGVKRPHRLVTAIDGQVFAESVVQELVVDPALSGGEFARPGGGEEGSR